MVAASWSLPRLDGLDKAVEEKLTAVSRRSEWLIQRCGGEDVASEGLQDIKFLL
jgi:hypothetical protein